MVVDVLSNVPVAIGALLVISWYLYKVGWGVIRVCRGSVGIEDEEEMRESAEELDISRGGRVSERDE